MKIAAYNLKNGGFTNYDYEEELPPRMPQIRKAVEALVADCVCLVDTYRWKNIYTDAELAEMFGYPYAYQCELADETVEPDICLAFLSKYPVSDSEAVSLGSRNALRCTVEDGEEKTDIYTTYFYHADEDIRLTQTKLLLNDIESRASQRVVVAGDLNTFDNHNQQGNKEGIRELKELHPDLYAHVGPWVEDMMRGEVIKELGSKGILGEKTDFQASLATPLLHPALGPEAKWFRVDYVLASSNIKVSETVVKQGGIFEEASDHYPVVANIS